MPGTRIWTSWHLDEGALDVRLQRRRHVAGRAPCTAAPLAGVLAALAGALLHDRSVGFSRPVSLGQAELAAVDPVEVLEVQARAVHASPDHRCSTELGAAAGAAAALAIGSMPAGRSGSAFPDPALQAVRLSCRTCFCSGRWLAGCEGQMFSASSSASSASRAAAERCAFADLQARSTLNGWFL